MFIWLRLSVYWSLKTSIQGQIFILVKRRTTLSEMETNVCLFSNQGYNNPVSHVTILVTTAPIITDTNVFDGDDVQYALWWVKYHIEGLTTCLNLAVLHLIRTT